MENIKRIIESPLLRWLFLIVALTGLVWAVARNWQAFIAALAVLPWYIVVASLLLALVYVWFTLWSWKVILADLGSPLDWRASIQLFGISQIGKYIPGGVWNIVAAARIGHDHNIPARRSVAAMTIAVLISLVSGTGIGACALMTMPESGDIPIWAVCLLLGVLVVLLLPPVLNRIISTCFRLMKRPSLEQGMTFSGLGLSASLAVISWIVAGIQVWVLACGFGMTPTLRNMAVSIGAYALAWVAGFLAVVVPAGTGVREWVLGLLLAGMLSNGEVLAVILVSRITMTVADLCYAGIGMLLSRNDDKTSGPTPDATDRG
ncbi:lysylphosphatidylglycerol synthase domain-containing protein [Bifidobacterium sp. LCP19S3_H1]